MQQIVHGEQQYYQDLVQLKDVQMQVCMQEMYLQQLVVMQHHLVLITQLVQLVFKMGMDVLGVLQMVVQVVHVTLAVLLEQQLEVLLAA